MGVSAQTLFLFGCALAVIGWISSLVILNKMKSEGFGVSDLWNPTGELYRSYVREAKRRNWSLLPVYVPALLLAVFFLYFMIVLGSILRTTFS